MGACEPRQVREEAALSGASQVPRSSLARASVAGTVVAAPSKQGARPGISTVTAGPGARPPPGIDPGT